REAIRKSVEVIHNFTGKPPSGWLGPGLTETPETLDLLTEAGLGSVARWAKGQVETLYAEGAKSARVMAIAVHPYISGVPHRIKYFEKTLAYLKKQRGVLFWTGEQILDWYRSVQKAEGYRMNLSFRFYVHSLSYISGL